MSRTKLKILASFLVLQFNFLAFGNEVIRQVKFNKKCLVDGPNNRIHIHTFGMGSSLYFHENLHIMFKTNSGFSDRLYFKSQNEPLIPQGAHEYQFSVSKIEHTNNVVNVFFDGSDPNQTRVLKVDKISGKVILTTFGKTSINEKPYMEVDTYDCPKLEAIIKK